MRKTITLIAIFAFVFSMMPALATPPVTTSLTADTSGGNAPIVKAKWEANINGYNDASTNAGAQFIPSGVYQVSKTIKLCAIVTDPDALSDIDHVYVDVFYPIDIELGPSHVALPDQSGLGCGKLMQEDSLTKLSKAAGIDLFCNKVQNLNNDLPTFNQGYDYDEICALDGELQKETAAVYCGTKDLSYEDPSGDYEVWAVAQDKNGKQGVLSNHFTYLPLTAFETDFSSVSYGTVRLNTHKIISGDLSFYYGDGKPTVRNVGNTRLQMKVWQDDMGLGKTNGIWNVKWDARVGNNASDWAIYYPYHPSLNNYGPSSPVSEDLLKYLDLSEYNEMDFSIDISKFPPTNDGDSYTGNMTLSAGSVGHLTCE